MAAAWKALAEQTLPAVAAAGGASILRPPPAAAAAAAALPSDADVVVLDASFNPPTVAHLSMCLQACGHFRPQACLLSLAAANADKKLDGALPLADRIAMIGAAVDDLNARRSDLGVRFDVVAVAHARFVDKLAALQRMLAPDGDPPRIRFLLGYDTLIRFFNPKYYADMRAELGAFFRNRVDLVGFPRGDADMAALAAYLDTDDVAPFRAQIHTLALDAGLDAHDDISSSRVRGLIASGQPGEAAALVPAPVWRVLEEGHLYG